jgi:hypothetical protein
MTGQYHSFGADTASTSALKSEQYIPTKYMVPNQTTQYHNPENPQYGSSKPTKPQISQTGCLVMHQGKYS